MLGQPGFAGSRSVLECAVSPEVRSGKVGRVQKLCVNFGGVWSDGNNRGIWGTQRDGALSQRWEAQQEEGREVQLIPKISEQTAGSG